jgi:DNA repair exonuclease SbcCD nuclease subunit
MKFIHIADLHISEYYKYSIDGSRLKELLRNIKLIIMYAIKNKIPFIIIAGDVFDNPNPNERILRKFSALLRYGMDNGVFFKIITGNHDTDGSVHSLTSLKNIFPKKSCGLNIYSLVPNKISVYSEVIGGIKFTYVPYQKDIVSALKYSKKYKSSNKNVLVAHCAINGAFTNSGHKMGNTGIDQELLKGYDYVALGDYHTYQNVFENVFYSGSVIKIIWDENKSDKYFNVVDTDDFSVKKIKIPDINFIDINLFYDKIPEFISKYNSSYKGKVFKDSFVKVSIYGNVGMGENISILKRHLMDNGVKDVFPKINKTDDSNKAPDKADADFINLNLEEIFCRHIEENRIKDVDYKNYIIKKIVSVYEHD